MKRFISYLSLSQQCPCSLNGRRSLLPPPRSALLNNVGLTSHDARSGKFLKEENAVRETRQIRVEELW